jgi:uncharacterized protein YndB with AHSA1/START domain
MSMTETTEAVRKSVLVGADPDTAFRVFTDQIQSWWPLEKYGIFGEDAEALAFENEKIVERAKDGREAVWGNVLAWEPPRRLRMTWRPGFDPDTPDTEIEVLFTAEGDGTRVELIHTGWDKLADGAKTRAGYDGGWYGVLEAYRQAI